MHRGSLSLNLPFSPQVWTMSPSVSSVSAAVHRYVIVAPFSARSALWSPDMSYVSPGGSRGSLHTIGAGVVVDGGTVVGVLVVLGAKENMEILYVLQKLHFRNWTRTSYYNHI